MATVAPVVTKVAALAVAAIVATGGTVFLVMCVGMIADLAAGLGANANWVTLLLFGVGWSIILGFIGAFVALAVGVAIFGRGFQTRSYVIAGVAAGLLHCLAGIAIKLLMAQEGLAPDTEQVLTSIIMWGGFLLTNMPGWGVVVTTVVAAVMAGALAGFVYARLIGVRSAR